MEFPYRVFHKSTAAVHVVRSAQELVDALLTNYTTEIVSQHDSVLTEACTLAHEARMKELRSQGETVCEECNTHVMEQFMECSCACLAVPKDPIWIFDGVRKVRRTTKMDRSSETQSL